MNLCPSATAITLRGRGSYSHISPMPYTVATARTWGAHNGCEKTGST